MNSEQIRVIVADDHSMVRSGLRLFLMAFDDMTLVGEAANGLEAVRLCEQVHPNVLLMDLIMPVMDGIRAIREIRSKYPGIHVIGLTSFLDPGLLAEALQAGATGLLAKDVSASDLARSIREAHQGQMTFSPQVTELLEKLRVENQTARAEPAAPSPQFDLTTREREVLALMVSGLSNADIGEKLVISLSTAKFHVSSIFEKLNVSNRAEAVALALQYKLVDPHLPFNENEP